MLERKVSFPRSNRKTSNPCVVGKTAAAGYNDHHHHHHRHHDRFFSFSCTDWPASASLCQSIFYVGDKDVLSPEQQLCARRRRLPSEKHTYTSRRAPAAFPLRDGRVFLLLLLLLLLLFNRTQRKTDWAERWKKLRSLIIERQFSLAHSSVFAFYYSWFICSMPSSMFVDVESSVLSFRFSTSRTKSTIELPKVFEQAISAENEWKLAGEHRLFHYQPWSRSADLIFTPRDWLISPPLW